MMTKLSKGLSFIILTMVGIGACKKDVPVLPISGDCMPKRQFVQSWFSHDRFQYKAPYFNPLNSQEFVFQYMDFEEGRFELRSFNLETQENRLLIDGFKVISQPKWSREGWIAADNVYDYHIWIVNELGDSLRIVTNETFNLNPVWNASGTSLFYRHTPTQGVPNFYLKTGLSEQSLTDTLLRYNDAFQGYAGNTDVSIDNNLVASTFINNSFSIGTGNLENLYFDLAIDMYDTFNTAYPSGICWNADGSKIFISINGNGADGINGLFEIDISSGHITKLMDYCWDRQFSHISASSDGKYLIAERIDSYYRLNDNGEPYGDIAQNSSIFLIDLTTMEETKIVID